MDPFGYFKGLALTAALIGGVIAYDFWRERAEVYNVPVARARELLKSAPLPDYVLGSEPKQFDVDSRDPGKIVWIVKDDGREAMRFAALLSPVDPASTKVRIEISGPSSGPFGDVQRRLSEYRTIRHLYVIAMKERVAATLEGREFSLVAVIPATTLATLSAVLGLAAQETATSGRERQNIDRISRR
jgi:hypothetical protein